MNAAALLRPQIVAILQVCIMAGGGVTAANAAELVKQTGVRAVHGTGTLMLLLRCCCFGCACPRERSQLAARSTRGEYATAASLHSLLALGALTCSTRSPAKRYGVPARSTRLHGRRKGSTAALPLAVCVVLVSRPCLQQVFCNELHARTTITTHSWCRAACRSTRPRRSTQSSKQRQAASQQSSRSCRLSVWGDMVR